MSDNTPTNRVLNEVADLLVYFTHENQKWKEMLREKCPQYKTIEQRIADVTSAGIKAGVSEALAHPVMLRYAESEDAALTAEEVAAIVSKYYGWKKAGEAEQKAKDAAKTPPIKKKQ
jgi:hypothetical protein